VKIGKSQVRIWSYERDGVRHISFTIVGHKFDEISINQRKK
jgi:hypothetical protein